MTDSYLPPHLAAKLDQATPEIRYAARMIAAFRKELMDLGVPDDHATWLAAQVIWQVNEEPRKGGE